MRTHPLLLVAPALLATPAPAGITITGVPSQEYSLRRFNPCAVFHAIEFQAPMPAEEVPVLHGPMPKSWHVILELSIDQPHLANPVGVTVATASFYPGGVVTGGTCATLYGFTGPNLAPTLGQSSVSAWYGVDGIPNFAPTFADDQLIYRFTGIYDGMIIDTDILPMEMMITASIETECNLYSITNVRVKHRPDVVTPDPGP